MELTISRLLDTIGPFARSVDTLRALTECLFGTRASRSQKFRLPQVEQVRVPMRDTLIRLTYAHSSLEYCIHVNSLRPNHRRKEINSRVS